MSWLKAEKFWFSNQNIIRKKRTFMSRVSIVIPFYNCPYIDQAIESALNQTYPNIEVIVVNDGSTEYTEKLTPFLKQIVYVEKGNGGTASALNLGILNATGDYIAWLSSDDLYYKDKVSKQLNFMRQKNTPISYTNFSLINENNHVFSEFAGKYFMDKISFLQFLLVSNPINGCTVMMNKKIFSEIGFFNEKLKFTQDYDFWLRAVQHYEFFYMHEALVKYRIHNQMGTQRFHEILIKEFEMIKQRYDSAIGKLITKEMDLHN